MLRRALQVSRQTTTRLTFAVTVMGFVLFGTYGALMLDAEHRALRTAIEREVRLIGRSVQASAQFAIRDGQVGDIRAAVRMLERADPGLEMFVLGPGGRPIVWPTTDTLGSFGEQLLARAESGESEVLRFEPERDPKRVWLALPINSDVGAPVGALLLRRPVEDMRQDLATTRSGIVASVALFVLLTSLLGLLLGHLYVQRPAHALAEAMRRVRSGDLGSGVAVARQDEFGRLADEFNGMVVDLRDARSRLQDEAEARRALQNHVLEVGKLAVVGQLSAGLAHEIGSPLQVLSGRARALVDRPDDPERTRKTAEILVSQTDRITRIVDQLLHFSRRRPLRVEPSDVLGPIGAVVDLLSYEARRRGVRIEVSAVGHPPSVAFDADQMQQVVINLLNNALDACASRDSTPADGHRITVTVASDTIPGTTDEPVESVRIEVADTGVGIADADLPQIFEPFFTTRGGRGGTGLGLAVVRGIVTEHGGTIEASNRTEGGARVVVQLPVSGPMHGGSQ